MTTSVWIINDVINLHGKSGRGALTIAYVQPSLDESLGRSTKSFPNMYIVAMEPRLEVPQKIMDPRFSFQSSPGSMAEKVSIANAMRKTTGS